MLAFDMLSPEVTLESTVHAYMTSSTLLFLLNGHTGMLLALAEPSYSWQPVQLDIPGLGSVPVIPMPDQHGAAEAHMQYVYKSMSMSYLAFEVL